MHQNHKKNNKALIYSNRILPYSETFILQQALNLNDWLPILAGRQIISEIDTSPIKTIELGTKKQKFFEKIIWYIHDLLWIPRKSVLNKLIKINPSLIHAHFGTGGFEIYPIARALGVPLIVTLHGFDVTIKKKWWVFGLKGLKWIFYPYRLKKMSEMGVMFIAVSKAIEQRAIEYGIAKKNITVSYIGVDANRFQPGPIPLQERPKRILFIGRMVKKKAPLLIVRTFAEIREIIPDVELVMIGSGPLLKKAKRLANKLNAPVTFLGACKSEKVLAQLHQARVFCLPSITADNGDTEGLPISILEAGACGIPVVTSAKGGATEGIIHNRSGYKFNEGATEECKKLLVDILTNLNVISAMSISARAFILQNFNIESCTARLEKIYEGYANPKKEL